MLLSNTQQYLQNLNKKENEIQRGILNLIKINLDLISLLAKIILLVYHNFQNLVHIILKIKQLI